MPLQLLKMENNEMVREETYFEKAIILAAGAGTRLHPLTKSCPKALVDLGGNPLIRHVIEKLRMIGVTEVYVNLHNFSKILADYLTALADKLSINVSLSFEKTLLDTGGGIKKIVTDFKLESPILVHNVDIISDLPLRELFNGHSQGQQVATLAVQNRESRRYLLFDQNMVLCGRAKPNKALLRQVRKPLGAMVPLAFCGVYVISPQYFKSAKQAVFSSVDLMLNLAKYVPTKAIQFDKFLWADVGSKAELEKLRSAFGSDLGNRFVEGHP